MIKEMDTNDVVGLFSKSIPKSIETKNTSHGDDDFREALLVNLGNEKIVVKLSSNGFTDEKHLALWERIAKEYRDLGYYCPQYLRALDGTFPTILYKGRSCIAWGEEFSKYRSAEELINDKFSDKALADTPYFYYNPETCVFSFSPEIWEVLDRKSKLSLGNVCRQRLNDYFSD